MSLQVALNRKNDFSVCKLLGRLLKIFAPWNEKVLRPVSVLTFGIITFVVFAGIHFVIVPERTCKPVGSTTQVYVLSWTPRLWRQKLDLVMSYCKLQQNVLIVQSDVNTSICRTTCNRKHI